MVFDTLIIGAGLSGAVAFDTLAATAEDDSSILLVEARSDRCGGRSCTECIFVNGCECPVDTGGQWLGRCQTKMMELVHELGLQVLEQSFPPSSYGAPSQLIELAYYPLRELPSEVKQEIEEFERYLLECYQKIETFSSDDGYHHSENGDGMHTPDLFLSWDRQSIGQVIDGHCALPQSREQWHYLVQTVLAVDSHQCSFFFFLRYVYSWGGQAQGMDLLGDGPDGLQALKVKGGTMQITQLLIHRAQQRKSDDVAQVKYGCQIVSIDYSAVVVRDAERSNRSNGRTADTIRVVAADGSVFECRNVILAIAPTLIQNRIAFHPPLEEQRTRLYNHVTMASAVKVVLVFQYAFWSSNDNRDNSDNRTNYKTIGEVGPISNIFETQVGECPALVGLITGRHAEKYHAIGDDVQQKEAILSQIREMYCRSESCKNNPELLPQPLAYIAKDWIAEPHSGGCFAAAFPPSDEAIFARYSPFLRTPIVPHRLVLAGTESSTQFYGYLEGAARAGARAAQELIQ